MKPSPPNARPDTSVLRAAELIKQGKAAQAEPALRRRVQSAPGDANANRLLAIVLVQLGKASQAEFFARRAAESTESAAALDALGTVLAALGKLDEAVGVFERAVGLDPARASLHNGLGGALLNSKRYDEAAAAYRRARELSPENPAYWRHESAALGRALRTEEGAAVLREGVARFPDDLTLRSQLASLLNYLDVPPEEVRKQHVRVGALLERAIRSSPTFANARDPERPLRVGLLSADWFEHPVPHFLGPLFDHPHSGLRLIGYDASPKRDHVTERLRSLAAGWRVLDGLSDPAVAELMRKDAIDVAVDLGGHTLGARGAALAWGGAPVQISYLGYPNTTGMSAIGWRLVDSSTDPPGAERWSTEQLLRMDPCFLCFAPPLGSCDPAPPPSISRGHVTFGSFNNPVKISGTTIDLWSRVLRAVPGSSLVIKGVGLEVPAQRERLIAALAATGVETLRVRCLPTTRTAAEHLASYHEIDVALDTYPYHGTTTTCEALWMGAPVVTLEGPTHASRVGVSLLKNAGCEDWIARTSAEYVDLAARLALQGPERAALRVQLRERVARGSLGDTRGFVARFERMIREAWRAWALR